MNHIVIIGFMGSGKTRVGKRLAKDLGLPFIDVDRLIVKKMNMSVKEVFERFGEPFYRALETMAVKELSTDGERKVISVSAGLPLQEQNQKYLQMTSKFWLRFNKEKNLMKQRKTHHIYSCPGCGQKVRIPRGKGKIEIECPKCHTKFVKRS